MKLISFTHGDRRDRAGILVDNDVYDVNEYVAWELRRSGEPAACRMASFVAPTNMREFLAAGERALDAARRLMNVAVSAPDELDSIRIPRSAVRLEPPLRDPNKIIGVGHNFRDFLAETGTPTPKAPRIFAKFTNAICGPEDPIICPQDTAELGYEAEVALVIGKPGRRISEDDALDHIAGYMIFNDVTASDVQAVTNIGGKTFDNFAPTGPWILTTDEAGDASNLDIGLWVNGVQLQKSNTNQLLFGVRYLVAYLSRIFTFLPGDIIATGTPGGLAKHRKPPAFMKPGDVCTIKVDGLGCLENRIVAERCL